VLRALVVSPSLSQRKPMLLFPNATTLCKVLALPTPYVRTHPTRMRAQILYVLTPEDIGCRTWLRLRSPASGCVLSTGTFGIQTDLTHILLPAWLIRLEPGEVMLILVTLR
jgi:hypothetical protein